MSVWLLLSGREGNSCVMVMGSNLVPDTDYPAKKFVVFLVTPNELKPRPFPLSYFPIPYNPMALPWQLIILATDTGIKQHTVNGSTTPLILNLATGRDELSLSRHNCFALAEWIPVGPTVGPTAGLDALQKRKISCIDIKNLQNNTTLF